MSAQIVGSSRSRNISRADSKDDNMANSNSRTTCIMPGLQHHHQWVVQCSGSAAAEQAGYQAVLDVVLFAGRIVLYHALVFFMWAEYTMLKTRFR